MAYVPGKPPLPESFPQSDYTPFGYIDNPYHSAVHNRSGVIRSVPPMGFGWWARSMPWPYGIDVERPVSYLSFLHLSLVVGDASGVARAVFHTADDFKTHQVELVSRYHTKTMMSYDWSFEGLEVSASYFLAHENALVCILHMANHSGDGQPRPISVFATNIYGYPGHVYWGRDGVTASYQPDEDVAVSKVWAYGDVMVTGADRHSAAYKATSSSEEWDSWIYGNDLSSNDGALVRFHETSEPVYSVMAYPLEVPAGSSESVILCLARGVNEPFAVRQFAESVRGARQALARQLVEDENFYRHAPLLTGDWPEMWRHGWIYDLETLRMTIRPPVGIFRHPWDGMQVHTPRAVLGETCLDAFCLSYADIELAKEVLYGTFADAPVANVPCTREDGSMNMIGESGAECGTALTWGFPYLVIRSIYERDHDDAWIRRLYPYLKTYIEWWLANRTDEDGWFHADNSWESGQDGSRRFLHGDAQEGTPAHNVRTVDIEAGMAHAMLMMVDFARIAGQPQDVAMWETLAEDRIRRTRSMYVDGWFRDWDASQERPFLIEDYFDVMMLVPLSVGVATREQVEGVKPKFELFSQQPTLFLEWPSFWLPFSEAGWHAGLRTFIAEELVKVGERIYERTDARTTSRTSSRYPDRLPAQYNYRIPGVASEFWPVRLTQPFLNGCENYGWGATFPSLVIRNLFGFREADEDPARAARRFVLAPTLPTSLFKVGQTYGITNLKHRECVMDVHLTPTSEDRLRVRLVCAVTDAGPLRMTDASGQTVAEASGPERTRELEFEADNGAVYTVAWQAG